LNVLKPTISTIFFAIEWQIKDFFTCIWSIHFWKKKIIGGQNKNMHYPLVVYRGDYTLQILVQFALAFGCNKEQSNKGLGLQYWLTITTNFNFSLATNIGQLKDQKKGQRTCHIWINIYSNIHLHTHTSKCVNITLFWILFGTF